MKNKVRRSIVPKLPKCVADESKCKPSGHVAAGARWLDQAFPGWEREVNLSKFDLSDCDKCICGQVVKLGSLMNRKDFADGYNEAEAFLTCVTGYYNADEHLGFLDSRDQDAWVLLIKERFDTGLLSDLKKR